MFENPTKTEIDAFLRRIRTIAILGLSETPGRPSHNVAKALQKFGYRIVPVNPTATEILGERAWPDLDAAIAGRGPDRRGRRIPPARARCRASSTTAFA